MRETNKSSQGKTEYLGWAKRKQAARYAGVGERTFYDWLKRGDLRHVRLPTGTILTKFQWIDQYLQTFEVGKNSVKAQIEHAVDEALKDF